MGANGPEQAEQKVDVVLTSQPPPPPAPTTNKTCTFCGDEFPTRSALFRHLRKPAEHCPAPREDEGEKVMVLFGYDCLAGGAERGGGEEVSSSADNAAETEGAREEDILGVVEGGDGAMEAVLQAIGWTSGKKRVGLSQASSIGSRSCPLLVQEPGVSATADTACFRAPTKVLVDDVRKWIDKNNAALNGMGVRLLGRMSVPVGLHAEIHAARRRYEYVLPAWLLDETAEVPWTGPLRGEEAMIPLLQRMKGLALKPFGHCNGSNDGRRRRCPLWHNFSVDAVPHSPSVARRLYRFYSNETFTARGSNYVVLSVSGDAFVSQQVRGMVGLAVAAARGLIGSADISACIDPTRQDDLLPVPLAPVSPCSLAEVGYPAWQARLGGVCMSPGTEQRSNPPLKGWSDETTRTDAASFRRRVLDNAAGWWEGRQQGMHWLHDVLEPGALKLRREVDAANKRAAEAEKHADSPQCLGSPSSLSTADGLSLAEAPAAYAKVLKLLREADASGLWPDSTAARSLVISGATPENDKKSPTAERRAGREGDDDADENEAGEKKSVVDERETEAPQQPRAQQQTRGGSFTVGAFPPPCPPPRGNRVFPELTRAAFELEAVLLPDRPPSSTIAVNRHAKFKPHVDSGAGAGQSRSLIVGIGDYVGGELVVESEEEDIRYRPLEFNGWTQRHWTRPFKGERYSLVWFTPKGCEGVTGDARFAPGTWKGAAVDDDDGVAVVGTADV